QLRANAGLAPAGVMLRANIVREFRSERDQMRAGVFAKLLDGEFVKIEGRGKHQPGLAEKHLDEFTELEVIEAAILLAPECRDGGGADFHVAISAHGEMDAEEWVPQVGDGINIRAKAGAGLIGVEIKALEG